MALPLLVDGRAIGAIGLSFHAERAFDPSDRSLAFTLSHHCAQALERARLYQAAQEAVQTRDQFLSIAAHELRTPITVMKGNIDLLLRRAQRAAGLDARDQRTLHVIRNQGDRLNTLVALLLDVARIETGQFSIDRRHMSLTRVVTRIVEETRPGLEKHALRLEATEDPLYVAGDELRLGQVVENLLQNAIRYSPEGGEVEIRLARQGGTAGLSIRDQGIGIPAEDLPRIFTRFHRAHNAREAGIKSMGVGLYVVKEIVTRHGGTIRVDSREGQGTTFTVSLPLEEDAQVGKSPGTA